MIPCPITRMIPSKFVFPLKVRVPVTTSTPAPPPTVASPLKKVIFGAASVPKVDPEQAALPGHTMFASFAIACAKPFSWSGVDQFEPGANTLLLGYCAVPTPEFCTEGVAGAGGIGAAPE